MSARLDSSPREVYVDLHTSGGSRILQLECRVLAKEFRDGKDIILVAEAETGHRVTVRINFGVLADVPAPEKWDSRRATLVALPR